MPSIITRTLSATGPGQDTGRRKEPTLRDRLLSNRADWMFKKLQLDPSIPLLVNPQEGLPPLNLADPVPPMSFPGLFSEQGQMTPKTGFEVPLNMPLSLKQLMLGRYGI